MKKLFILLLFVGVIRIGSLLYFDAQLLEQPIPLAQDAILSSGAVHISYVTNRAKPSDINYIEIDGYSLYPNSNLFFPFYNTPTSTARSYADYTYYSIYTAAFELYDEQLIDEIAKKNSVKIYFNDGTILTTPLHIKTYDVNTSNILNMTTSSSGADGNFQIYNINEPFTIESIKVLNDLAQIAVLKVNGQLIELPLKQALQLEKQDKLYIKTMDGISYYPEDIFFIELQGKNTQQQEQTLRIMQNINNAPTEQFVKEIVEERTYK